MFDFYDMLEFIHGFPSLFVCLYKVLSLQSLIFIGGDMIEFGKAVFQGAVTGIAAEKTKEQIENVASAPSNEWEEHAKRYQPLTELIEKAVYFLKNISDALSVQGNPDLEQTIVIPAQPSAIRLIRANKSHNMIFLKASTTLFFDIPTIGQFTTPTALPFGWNLLDVIDGTTISVPVGANPVIAIYRASDNAIGRYLS